MIVHMPLINSMFPANIIFFYSLIIDMSSFNIFQDYIDELNMFEFSENDLPNLNFELMDIFYTIKLHLNLLNLQTI